jgi:glyoxylase-like metal-dependent hydrolase (beta-lactamase superfamily II)
VSEPKAVATDVLDVVAGVRTWRIVDERIGDSTSAAYAVVGDAGGTVLIDPLPLVPAALVRLEPVSAIVLTAGAHQRSAWRYRRELGAPVHAPALSKELDEEPDGRYADGDVLPGGLTAVFTPGAGTTQHTLLLGGDPGVAFVPDLLFTLPDRRLELTPAEYVYDPVEQRRSVERLLELPFSVLCLAHGDPVTSEPRAAIRSALGQPGPT